MPVVKEGDNLLDHFGSHINKKLTIKGSDIKDNDINLISKSLDIENRAKDILLGYIFQNRLFESELLSFLKEVQFIDQEFVISILVSNIKYNYPKSQNDNLFYLFHDQLNYALANYFAKFKTIKRNIDKFLSKLLIISFTKKLSY